MVSNQTIHVSSKSCMNSLDASINLKQVVQVAFCRLTPIVLKSLMSERCVSYVSYSRGVCQKMGTLVRTTLVFKKYTVSIKKTVVNVHIGVKLQPRYPYTSLRILDLHHFDLLQNKIYFALSADSW